MSKDTKENLGFIGLLVVVSMAMGIACGVAWSLTAPTYPTVEEATDQILKENPECAGKIELVEERDVSSTWRAPDVITTYVVCDIDGDAIRIIVKREF